MSGLWKSLLVAELSVEKTGQHQNARSHLKESLFFSFEFFFVSFLQSFSLFCNAFVAFLCRHQRLCTCAAAAMLSNSRASALKPGSPVSVFTTPLSELALGSGVVHKVATDGTVEVHLDWNLADGRPACLYSQANCLRLDDRVTTPGAEVAVFSSAAQSSRSAKPTQVFTRGVVAGVVRNPDMVKVNLQWNLADGAPASLFTPAANLQLVADVEAAQAEAEARSKRMALARHAAQFKARTKVIVLSTPSSTPPGSDSERPVLSWGTVSRNRFANKTCIVDLPWKLADGTSAKLFAASSNLRLPNREESLRHAASLKDEGGVQFSKKEYFTALQVSTMCELLNKFV